MKHSLVVGGAGFIGSWVVADLLQKSDDKVTVLDNLISSEMWNIPQHERVNLIVGSAGDYENLSKIVTKVDKVFLLSCFHGNQSSMENPLADLENNLKPTLTVLDWVDRHQAGAKVVYSGAGCAVAPKTWDTPTGVPEVDETPILHDSPYSISKVTGEMYAKYFSDRRNLDIVRVRFQNAYGPREILGAGQWRGTEHTIWRNVVPTLIWKALNGHDLTLHDASNSSRDFVYVQDLARGVIKASEIGLSGEVYNLASGKEMNILSLAKLIIEMSGSKSKIVDTGRRPWDHSGRRFGDPAKSKLHLNFVAETSMEEGIELTLNWTKENFSKIEASINRHYRQ